MHTHDISFTCIIGGDASMWQGIGPDFSEIQSDIIYMWRTLGCETYSGMENSIGLETFRGKLDTNWHIQNQYKDDAVAWIIHVLKDVPGVIPSMAWLASPPTPPIPSTQIVPELEPDMQSWIVVSDLEPDLQSRHTQPVANVRRWNRRNAINIIARSPELELEAQASPNPTALLSILASTAHDTAKNCSWKNLYDYVAQYSTNPTLTITTPHVAGTVLVATSGMDECREQLAACIQKLTHLGWQPIVIYGVRRADMPPISWRIGCKASFAWTAAIMPQVESYSNRLCDGQFLALAEDSCWAANQCTPSNVLAWHGANAATSEHCNALWLGAVRGSIPNCHWIGGEKMTCIAPSGCKLFSGDKRFWTIASEAFRKLNKDWAADAVFQLLSGAGLLKVPTRFPAASLQHYSARTQTTADASDFVGRPKLRPLPVLGSLQ